MIRIFICGIVYSTIISGDLYAPGNALLLRQLYTKQV